DYLEPRQLLSLNTGIAEYPTTSPVSQPIEATSGGDGNLWVTEYAAKTLAAFTPTGSLARTVTVSGMPYAITSTADGTLWFTVNGATPEIGRFSPISGGSPQYYALPAGSNPQGIGPGPDGNLWFVEYGTSAVGRITPGGSITTYALSAGSRPARIVTG